jgi:hypothetical protein
MTRSPCVFTSRPGKVADYSSLGSPDALFCRDWEDLLTDRVQDRTSVRGSRMGEADAESPLTRRPSGWR